MQEKVAAQAVSQLREELKRQTGRDDIEVTVSPYCSYDVLVSAANADKHPIVDFYSDVMQDPARIKTALDYAVGMLQNWEVTQVLHEKAKQDCVPFHERLKREFPHIEIVYNVIDFDKHSLIVQRLEDNKIVASLDLWPRMSVGDVERLVSYIRECEATLHREQEKVSMAAMAYWWK